MSQIGSYCRRRFNEYSQYTAARRAFVMLICLSSPLQRAGVHPAPPAKQRSPQVCEADEQKCHSPQQGDFKNTALTLEPSHFPNEHELRCRILLFIKDWRQILHLQIAVVLMTLHDPCKENSLTTASLGLQQIFSFLSQFRKKNRVELAGGPLFHCLSPLHSKGID